MEILCICLYLLSYVSLTYMAPVDVNELIENQSIHHRVKRAKTRLPINAALVLREHNRIRRIPTASNMEYLSYSEELAEMAYGLAKGCEFKYNTPLLDTGNPRTTKNPRYVRIGQNIYHGSTAVDLFNHVEQAMKAWHSSSRSYIPFNDTCLGDNSECRHYKQLIWSQTTEVGCAAIFCDTLYDVGSVRHAHEYFLVCNYNPGYGEESEIPYMVGNGVRCSDCTGTDATCYDGLCRHDGEGYPITEGPALDPLPVTGPRTLVSRRPSTLPPNIVPSSITPSAGAPRSEVTTATPGQSRPTQLSVGSTMVSAADPSRPSQPGLETPSQLPTRTTASSADPSRPSRSNPDIPSQVPTRTTAGSAADPSRPTPSIATIPSRPTQLPGVTTVGPATEASRPTRPSTVPSSFTGPSRSTTVVATAGSAKPNSSNSSSQSRVSGTVPYSLPSINRTLTTSINIVRSTFPSGVTSSVTEPSSVISGRTASSPKVPSITQPQISISNKPLTESSTSLSSVTSRVNNFPSRSSIIPLATRTIPSVSITSNSPTFANRGNVTSPFSISEHPSRYMPSSVASISPTAVPNLSQELTKSSTFSSQPSSGPSNVAPVSGNQSPSMPSRRSTLPSTVSGRSSEASPSPGVTSGVAPSPEDTRSQPGVSVTSNTISEMPSRSSAGDLVPNNSRTTLPSGLITTVTNASRFNDNASPFSIVSRSETPPSSPKPSIQSLSRSETPSSSPKPTIQSLSRSETPSSSPKPTIQSVSRSETPPSSMPDVQSLPVATRSSILPAAVNDVTRSPSSSRLFPSSAVNDLSVSNISNNSSFFISSRSNITPAFSRSDATTPSAKNTQSASRGTASQAVNNLTSTVSGRSEEPSVANRSIASPSASSVVPHRLTTLPGLLTDLSNASSLPSAIVTGTSSFSPPMETRFASIPLRSSGAGSSPTAPPAAPSNPRTADPASMQPETRSSAVQSPTATNSNARTVSPSGDRSSTASDATRKTTILNGRNTVVQPQRATTNRGI